MEGWIEVSEASRLLGVSPQRIYALAKEGKLEIFPKQPPKVHLSRIKELAKDKGIKLPGEETQNA